MSILSSNNLILKYFKGTDPEEKEEILLENKGVMQ